MQNRGYGIDYHIRALEISPRKNSRIYARTSAVHSMIGSLRSVRACANSRRGKYLHRITRVLIIGVAGLSLSGTTVVQVREEERRQNM